MSRYASLAVFLVVVLGGGLLIGYATPPGDWYAALEKPSFNPPGWLFGPVWSVLYVLIAIAGWRVWRASGNSTLRVLWIVQLVLNFLWSPVFFGAQMPGAALVVIIALLPTILAFIASAWGRDRVAGWLFVPYVAWVAFATLLNFSIVWLN